MVFRFAACFLKFLLSWILPLIQQGVFFFPKGIQELWVPLGMLAVLLVPLKL